MQGFDPYLQESLLSALFILLGSVAFNISALISGYNVYKEMAGLQSIALSLGAGIIVFFLSPVGFIFAFTPDPTGSELYRRFFDFDVLIPFFLSSLGLGLIFGSLVDLEARENLLLWFRDRSGIRFWINSYSIIWDFFFRRVRRGGEITVKTKSGENLDCLLEYYSMRKVPREIVIKSCQDDEGHMLIRGSDIESIKVPPHSFMKHHGLITPIGQAFYTALICLGMLLLSFSAGQTGSYISGYGWDPKDESNLSLSLNETGTYISISGLDFIVASNISLDVNEIRTYNSTSDMNISAASKSFLSSNETGTYISISGLNLSAAFNSSLKANETGTYHIILDRGLGHISTFYEEIQKYLFYISVATLFLSMWVARRDYISRRAWFSISSDCWFVLIISGLLTRYYFKTTSFETLFGRAFVTKFLIIVCLLLAVRSLIYILIVRYMNKNILNELEKESIGYESLNKVIRTFYTCLCRDFPYESRSRLENVRDEVYNRLPKEDRELAESFIIKINIFKNKFKYLKLRDEDYRLLCILLTRLNHPIFSPVLHGRYEPNLEKSIMKALDEPLPAKKAMFLLNIASNVKLSPLNKEDLKKELKDDIVLQKCVSLLKTEDDLRNILHQVKKIFGESNKSEILSTIISRDDMRLLAFRAAEDIKDDTNDYQFIRANIMVLAASNLPSPDREEKLKKSLMDLIEDVKPEEDGKRYLKSKTLAEMAPKLPDELREKAIAEALKSANSIEERYYRSKALVEIAPLLPDPLKEELLKQAREAIRGTDSDHFEMNFKYSG